MLDFAGMGPGHRPVGLMLLITRWHGNLARKEIFLGMARRIARFGKRCKARFFGAGTIALDCGAFPPLLGIAMGVSIDRFSNGGNANRLVPFTKPMHRAAGAAKEKKRRKSAAVQRGAAEKQVITTIR
jgi:hypothetical protein